VFIALMNAPDAQREALASLTRIWSGGAPIPPSTVKAFQAQFGQYIHNIYGLTETTSPSHGVPYDATAPVDDASGALSVGVPIFNTVVRVVGDDGRDLPAGEVGEIVTSGTVKAYQPAPRPERHGRGAHRLLPRADGRLQVPPPGRVPRRAAQDGLRQAAPPRTPRPRLARPPAPRRCDMGVAFLE
jgi:hypothetical protein